MAALLVAVQLPDILWVALNYLGVESAPVALGFVQFKYRPFSHSVVGVILLITVAFWIIALGFRRRRLAAAIALAIATNLLLQR